MEIFFDVYVYLCVCACVRARKHVCACVYVCICVYACMYVHACMRACMCMRVGGVSKDIFEEMVISFHSVLQRWNSGHCAPMTSADTL